MSCNSSLIVLLALGAVLATPLLLLYNSPTLCYRLIQNTSPQRVGIHFHVLFKACSSISSTLSRIELFVSAAELFLADRIHGFSNVSEVRYTAVFGQTAQSSLKRTGPDIWRARAAFSPIRWWLGMIHISLFDGPRFDSLLPVSVKAELNVKQGPDREKHERKQIELRAARLSSEVYGRKELAEQRFWGPRSSMRWWV